MLVALVVDIQEVGMKALVEVVALLESEKEITMRMVLMMLAEVILYILMADMVGLVWKILYNLEALNAMEEAVEEPAYKNPTMKMLI